MELEQEAQPFTAAFLEGEPIGSVVLAAPTDLVRGEPGLQIRFEELYDLLGGQLMPGEVRGYGGRTECFAMHGSEITPGAAGDEHWRVSSASRRNDEKIEEAMSRSPAVRAGLRLTSCGMSKRRDQAFFTQAAHQPLASTSLPPNAPQGPQASPALPWKSEQLPQT